MADIHQWAYQDLVGEWDREIPLRDCLKLTSLPQQLLDELPAHFDKRDVLRFARYYAYVVDEITDRIWFWAPIMGRYFGVVDHDGLDSIELPYLVLFVKHHTRNVHFQLEHNIIRMIKWPYEIAIDLDRLDDDSQEAVRKEYSIPRHGTTLNLTAQPRYAMWRLMIVRQKVVLYTPYHPDLPKAAKALKGRWNKNFWSFPLPMEDKVRKMAEDIYGKQDDEFVDVIISLGKGHIPFPTTENAVWLFGRCIGERNKQDKGFKLHHKGLDWGGSTMVVDPDRDTVLEVLVDGVPKSLVEKELRWYPNSIRTEEGDPYVNRFNLKDTAIQALSRLTEEERTEVLQLVKETDSWSESLP